MCELLHSLKSGGHPFAGLLARPSAWPYVSWFVSSDLATATPSAWSRSKDRSANVLGWPLEPCGCGSVDGAEAQPDRAGQSSVFRIARNVFNTLIIFQKLFCTNSNIDSR